MLTAIAKSAGGTDQCRLYRPWEPYEGGIRSIFVTHHKALECWLKADEEGPSDNQVNRLKTDLKALLGLPVDASIIVRYGMTRDKTQGELHVLHNEETVFSATFDVDEARATQVKILKSPKRESHTETKKNALLALEKEAPGKAGMTFVFDGHGSGKQLFLTKGVPSGEGFDGEGEAISISADEFAKSYLRRQVRFVRSPASTKQIAAVWIRGR